MALNNKRKQKTEDNSPREISPLIEKNTQGPKIDDNTSDMEE
jgi:hypothetical protein